MEFLNFKLRSFLKIFLVSSVPLVSWSSLKPNNLKPTIKTFIFLFIGLFIFGLGESILVISQYGVTPWTVLAEGFAKKIKIGIGLSTFIVSVIVLIFWLPLKLKPGLGTVMNVFVIAMTMGGTIPFLYFLNDFFNGLFLSFLGTFLVGFGSGIYLIANLGPGARDGLMTGISVKYNKPISLVRFSIEFFVVFLGWILGGTLGVGTLIFAIFIGPFVSLSLKIVTFLNK